MALSNEITGRSVMQAPSQPAGLEEAEDSHRHKRQKPDSNAGSPAPPIDAKREAERQGTKQGPAQQAELACGQTASTCGCDGVPAPCAADPPPPAHSPGLCHMESCGKDHWPESRGAGQGPASEAAGNSNSPAAPGPERPAALPQAVPEPQHGGGASSPTLRQSRVSQEQRERQAVTKHRPSPAASPAPPTQGVPSPPHQRAPAAAAATTAGGAAVPLAPADVDAPATAAGGGPPPDKIPSLVGVHPRILHLAVLLFSNPPLAQQLEQAMMAIALALGTAPAAAGIEIQPLGLARGAGPNAFDLPTSSSALCAAAAAAAAAAAGRGAWTPSKRTAGPGVASEAPGAAMVGARRASPASVLPGGAPVAAGAGGGGRGAGTAQPPEPDRVALDQPLKVAASEVPQGAARASPPSLKPSPLSWRQQGRAQKLQDPPPPPPPLSAVTPPGPWTDPLLLAYLRMYRQAGQQHATQPQPAAFPGTPHRSIEVAGAEMSGEVLPQQRHPHHPHLHPQNGRALPATPLVAAPLAQYAQHGGQQAQHGQRQPPSEDVRELAQELWSLQRLLEGQRAAAEEGQQLAATAARVAPGVHRWAGGPPLSGQPPAVGGAAAPQAAEVPPAALGGALFRAGPGAPLAPPGHLALPAAVLMSGQEGPGVPDGDLRWPLHQRAVIEALVQEQQQHVMAQQAQRAMHQRAQWEQQAMQQRAQQLVWEEELRAQQAQQQLAMQQRAQRLVWEEEQQLAQQQLALAKHQRGMEQQAPITDRQQGEQAQHAVAARQPITAAHQPAMDQHAQQEEHGMDPGWQQAQQPPPQSPQEGAPQQAQQEGPPSPSRQTPARSFEPAEALLAWLEQRQETAADLAGDLARGLGDPGDPMDPQQDPQQDAAGAGGLGSVFWQASVVGP